MRLVHAAAWTLATTAAVTLSWFGVHEVMTSTAYPPRTVPVSGAEPDGRGEAASTHRPPATPSAQPSPSPSPSARSSAPRVKTYAVPGGQVSFALHPTYAELVSATPAPGWSMQQWKQEGWIRVDFTRSDRRNAVICSWNGHAPTVSVDAHAT